MLRFLIVAAVVAFVSATEKDCCSVEDRHEVVSLWENVWSAQYTGRRVAIAQAIFAKMFEQHDDVQGLFGRVGGDDTNSAKFRAHVVRVANGVDSLVNMGSDPSALMKQVEHYGKKHKSFDGFKAEMFSYFLHASNEVLPQVISCFNKAAWTRCIGYYSSLMAHYFKAE